MTGKYDYYDLYTKQKDIQGVSEKDRDRESSEVNKIGQSIITLFSHIYYNSI